MVNGAVWFRTDLRLDDNPALNSAMEKCGQIVGIYLFSEAQWNLHNESNIKQEFLLNNLASLDKSLSKLNIPLIGINTDSYKTLPKDLLKFLVKQKIDNVFWNNEFGINES
mgnify:FL=1